MKKLVSFVVRLAFIAALVILLFKPEFYGLDAEFFGGVSPAALWEVLRSADASTLILWLAMGTLVKLCGIGCGILRWKILLRGQGLTMPAWELAQSWFTGRAIGLLVPGTLGLDGWRLVDSAQRTREPIKCATVVAVEKLTGFIALTLLVFLTFPLGFRLLNINVAILGAVLLMLGTFVVVSFVLLLNPRIIQVVVSVLPLPAKIYSKVEKLGLALTAYSRNRGSLLLAVLLGLGVHFAICLVYFCTAAAIRADNTNLTDILFVAPLVIYASVLTPTVSGLGVREIIFGAMLGDLEGTGKAVLYAHLAYWAGEFFPFLISIPLLLKVRASREAIQTEVASVRAAVAASDAHFDLPKEQVLEFRRKIGACLLAGLLGGLVAGAILGMAEAGWLTSRLAGLTEYQALWWGPAAYAKTMAFAGLGVAAGLVFLYLLFRRFAAPSISFGITAAALLAGPGFVGAWWRYKRDVLLEHAPPLTTTLMILASVGAIAVAAGLVFALAAHVLRGRRMAGIVAVLLFVLAVAGTGVGLSSAWAPKDVRAAFAPPAKATGPNVILIAVDTLRADYLQMYSAAAKAYTPALDAFAKDSVLFKNTFAQSSWTKPSFGTIFTGRYPTSHGATTKSFGLDPNVETFPETLQAAGYYTQGFANNPNLHPTFGFDQGYVEYVDLGTERNWWAEYSSSKLIVYEIARKVKEKVNARLPAFLGGKRLNIREYHRPAEDVTDAGLAWLDTNVAEGAPYFLFMHYMDPHDPFMDPDHPGRGYARSQMENPDPETYQQVFIRGYIHAIEHLDTELGRLFDALKARGIYDDSVIVFTSDHGEEFHEHGGWWHGQTLYDEVIGVPLLIKLPKNQIAGAVNEHMARLLDLAPTVLMLAGLTPGAHLQGQSLFAPDMQPGNALVGSSYAELDFEAIVMDALRTPTFKLIHSNDNKRNHPPVAFFDLTADPFEQTNKAGDGAFILDQETLEANRTEMQKFLDGNAADPSLVQDMTQLRDRLDASGYGGSDGEEVEE